MKNLFKLWLILAYLVCFAEAQTLEDKEVEIQQKVGMRNLRCWLPDETTYTAESLKKLASQKDCSIVNLLKVDFTKQTVVGYRVGGDCFLTTDAQVFRNDTTKTFTVRIINYWGGCRAGGSFTGWLVFEKVPDDYKIEFSEIKAETGRGSEFPFGISLLKTLESREIDLKGCIQTIFTKQFVIKTEADYLKTIRNDASRDYCLKNVEKIDFEKNSLLGIEINSGYCHRPVGLEFQVIKDARQKNYDFNISYVDPKGSVCRALSQYDLWVIVPKIPFDFEVKFNVQGKSQ